MWFARGLWALSLHWEVISSDIDPERVKLRAQTMEHVWKLWRGEEGQDIAEYAVMLAVILVIVVGTVRLIGSNANNVFSNVASSIQ
jgi:Flp pilus assembly pilin Flp